MEKEKDVIILVVDDEEGFRKMMTFWLKSKGYSVVAVPDGKTAIQQVKEATPDIVLLDLRMPVMDGIEVLKKIRKFNKEVPIIIISAYVDHPGTKDMLSYGVSGVFYKGMNFEEVLPLLETALRKHKKLIKEE